MIRQINHCATACCAIQIHYPTQSSGMIVQQAVGQFARIRSVTEYVIEQALPTTRQDKLPSIEQIERELARELNQGESEQ
ncbi:hypothetical protein MACH16_22150 [Marinomonas pontica]|uniref:Uncharacterized protein n=1 Tax=Marinomonas pontica TaxID=264739 RepID=A0ABM8FEH1_9GAMM|nr:hypothetical protein MACH16_22150 [Marinomonas pontica]